MFGQRLLAFTADAKGVLLLGHLHSMQGVFNLSYPSTVIPDTQGLSSDWLFDLALKQVRLVVVRFRVVVVRVRVVMVRGTFSGN